MHWEHKASDFIGNAFYIIDRLDLRWPGQDLIRTPCKPSVIKNVLKNIILLASTDVKAYINASDTIHRYEQCNQTEYKYS